MKNNIAIIMIICLLLFILVGCSTGENSSSAQYKAGSKIEEPFQIRFKDLVTLKSLEKYNNQTVTAVGYLSPIMGYDNSFGYLMNLPYQTCPYCLPSDTKITNTIAIFAPEGNGFEYTEAAVVVTGTLKLEYYEDDYGYAYKYRIVDAQVEMADTDVVDEKVSLYNQIADKEILSKIIDSLYGVDDNVFYEQYIMDGYTVNIHKVDIAPLEEVIKEIGEMNNSDLDKLKKLAEKTKSLADIVNSSIDNEDVKSLKKYQDEVSTCFELLNDWMAEYEL